GYLNIPAALGSTIVATQTATSPSLTIDADGNVIVDPNRCLWGCKAIWGSGITDLKAIWGSNCLWGTDSNILNASKALWGSSVWSDRCMWGTDSSAADLSSTAINGEN